MHLRLLCGYRKQWSEDKINNAVEEVIRKLMQNSKFEEPVEYSATKNIRRKRLSISFIF